MAAFAACFGLSLGSFAAAAERETGATAPASETNEQALDRGSERDPDAPASQPAKTSRGKAAKSGDQPPPSSRPSSPPPEFRGPDITLIASEERTVYEYRQNGQLRMIKVVPKFGKPYYLTPRDPTRGFGDLEQADMLLAEWVLWEF